MDEPPKLRNRPESTLTIFIFFMFGFLAFFICGSVTTSAEDLLTGTSSSTGMVWVALSIPYSIIPTILSYFFDCCPTLVPVLTLFPVAIGGLTSLLLGKTMFFKYLGVALLGTLDIIGDVTAVSLTAYFDKITFKSYCTGSGIGFVLGPLYYTAMTSWFHISYKITLSVVLILEPTIYVICYLMLEKRRNHSVIGYERVDNDIDKRIDEDIEKDIEKDIDKQHEHNTNLTMVDKLRHSITILPSVTQIFLGFLLNDIVTSGVTTTIAFSNSPFSLSDHYKYYLITSFVGLCLGRSYLGLIEFIKPGLSDKIIIRRTWVLVVFSFLHAVLLILDSLYRFIPNVWITILVVFSLGVSTESIYVNVNVMLSEIQDPRVRELSLGLAVFGVGFGGLIGSIISGPIETVLVNHCLKYANEPSLCLTRGNMFHNYVNSTINSTIN